MKNSIKQCYSEYKPFLEGFFTIFGAIAIFEWVVAPGLTAANTFINILSAALGVVTIMIIGTLIWKNLFVPEKEFELTEEEKEKIMTNIRNRGSYQESKPIKEGKTKSNIKSNKSTKKSSPPPPPSDRVLKEGDIPVSPKSQNKK